MQKNRTAAGKPINWFVEEQIQKGVWRQETVAASVVGLSRDVTILRAARKSNPITHEWHGDTQTFCPPMWYDLAIGRGACGLGCRACFLLLSFRAMNDPLRPIVYDNVDFFARAAMQWLASPQRRRQHTLGVGIDHADSLLYEGITGHVRTLAPLFASPEHNPNGSTLILLTKIANTHYLAEITPEHRKNVVASFSLNPEPIADLWEGKWPDTAERITPSIQRRLAAVRYAQDLGYEVRVRVDPVLTPVGWEDAYTAFVNFVKDAGITFRYWTLGTYREKNVQLDGWRERWGLPPMEWHPPVDQLVQDGTHRRVSEAERIRVYGRAITIIRNVFPDARVSLCKETNTVRKALRLCNADCNCLM